MKAKPFCNYEHMGGCSDTLTARVDYFVGAARQRFGRYAHWCERHATDAGHIPLEPIRPIARSPRPSPPSGCRAGQ
jgi:hypothetical protein